MTYFHMATNEWVSAQEMQRRLDNGFDFKCNDCHKSIENHVSVLAQGIFCPSCRDKLIEDLEKIMRAK